MTASTQLRQAAPVIRKEHRNHHTQDSKKALRMFASALIRRREELGISRRKLCEEANVSYSLMSHVELGENWPTLPVYRALCRVLKVGKPPMMR
jgi:ribosome-binding protein aMBF1 (putative translation factor)